MGEPGHDAFQIDADRNQNVLEMRFRETIASLPGFGMAPEGHLS